MYKWLKSHCCISTGTESFHTREFGSQSVENQVSKHRAVILCVGTGCSLGSVPQLNFCRKVFSVEDHRRVHRKSGLKVNVLHEKSSCKQDLGRLFWARMKV